MRPEVVTLKSDCNQPLCHTSYIHNLPTKTKLCHTHVLDFFKSINSQVQRVVSHTHSLSSQSTLPCSYYITCNWHITPLVSDKDKQEAPDSQDVDVYLIHNVYIYTFICTHPHSHTNTHTHTHTHTHTQGGPGMFMGKTNPLSTRKFVTCQFFLLKKDKRKICIFLFVWKGLLYHRLSSR